MKTTTLIGLSMGLIDRGTLGVLRMRRVLLLLVLLLAFVGVASAAPVVFSDTTVTALTNTSATIRYDTDMAATGQIEYGLDTGYGNLTAVEGLSYWHPMEVTGLTSGTTYHYRIRAKDYKGNETISIDYNFTTRTNVAYENVIKAARISNDLPKTYYVKPSGSDSDTGLSLGAAWATPYHAAQVAEAGDTIFVVDGTYTGYVGFGFYVSPVHHGISEAPITMKAYNGTPEIVGEIDIRANYITFDGFVCHDPGGHGIDIRTTTGIKILNCEVYNSAVDCIYIHDSNYVIVEDFYIHDSGWNGIGIKPTTKWPFSGHHHILKNGRVIDSWYHNSFDVQSDYLTIENCTTDNIPAHKPDPAYIGAPYRINLYHSVINNCSGEHGNNGIKTAGASNKLLILNCTFPDFGFLCGHTWYSFIMYKNYINYNEYAVNLLVGGDSLIEENDFHSSEIFGYTYGIEGGGNVIIRNEENSPYKAKSVGGATITVEYTDGRTFSVNGAGEYTTYEWSSGTRTIAVIGWAAGNVSGRVTDTATGLAIEGATVSDGTRSDDTNATGWYLISNVPADTYNVTCTSSPIYISTYQAGVVVNDSEAKVVNFTLTKETTPPTITTHSPTGTTVAVSTTISTTFTESMNTTPTEGAFSISPSVSGTFSWDSNKMIFTPDSNLGYTTNYTVNVTTDAKDLAGNNLASLYSWQFTTVEQDVTPPVVSNVTESVITGSSATIIWDTDESSTSQIEYGLNTSYGSSTTLDSNLVTDHSQAIVGIDSNTKYHYRVKSNDSVGNAAVSGDYNFTTLNETNVSAHWKFDENTGSAVNDSSGNNNNGTTYGATWTTGRLNSALKFDGTNDYISIPNSSSLNPSDNITLEAWVKTGTIPQAGWNKIIAKPYTSRTSPWQQYALTLCDDVFVFELNTGGVKEDVTSTTILESDTWYHVAGTYNGSLMVLYLNGEPNGTLSKSGTITTYRTDVHIGAEIYSDAQTEYVNATIDDVRILNIALGATEVKADYEAGLPPAWTFSNTAAHFNNTAGYAIEITTKTDGTNIFSRTPMEADGNATSGRMVVKT